MWVHVPVLHVVFWWLWFYITIISWYPWQFMNLIGFNDSEIHTHTKKSWKNGHKLKMSLSMVNKEKDIHLFDIFIEKHSIAPDKTMAWQNSKNKWNTRRMGCLSLVFHVHNFIFNTQLVDIILFSTIFLFIYIVKETGHI